MTRILGLCCLIFAACAQAQDVPLSVHKHNYPSDKVVRLYDGEKVSIELKGDDLEIKRHVLDKILYLDKKAGNYGDRSLRYTEEFYVIDDIKAYTYVPDGEKYKRKKVKHIETKDLISDDVFYDGQKARMFSFPSLTYGAISETGYVVNIKDPKFIGAFYFQSNLFTEKIELEIRHDKDVEMQFEYFQCNKDDFQHTIEEDGDEIVHYWSRNNIEKLEFESKTPGYSYIAPHVMYRVKSYKTDNGTTEVLNNVINLYEWYSGLVQEAANESDEDIKLILKDVLKGDETDEEKVRKIYQWVQGNIKYIAVEDGLGGYKPRNPSTTFKKRYGDCKDMSSLIVNMLKEAGLEGRYAWIGTRELPYTYEQVPTPQVDNHMIACVKLNGKYCFLDATSSYLPFNYPSSFIQGKQALIYVDKDSFDIATVEAVPAAKNLYQNEISIAINEKNELVGNGYLKTQGYYTNYHKAARENIKDGKDHLKMIKSLTNKGSNKYRVETVSRDTLYNDITETEYTYALPDYIIASGDELILNLNLERIITDDEMKEDRKYPYSNDFAYTVKRKFKLKIPEGYTLSYMPESLTKDYGDYGFGIGYEVLENEVIYTLNVRVETLLLMPSEFEKWNTMIKDLRGKYNESIVLKKI